MDGWVRSERSKTKAGEYREVPLMPELRAILGEHRAWIEKKLGAVPGPYRAGCMTSDTHMRRG